MRDRICKVVCISRYRDALGMVQIVYDLGENHGDESHFKATNPPAEWLNINFFTPK